MLQGWAKQAAEHWKRYRPKMYRELAQSGQLERRAEEAAEQTKDALCDALESGMKYDQAWESIRSMWMFLPDEEDVPNLGEDPQSQPDPCQLLWRKESTKPKK